MRYIKQSDVPQIEKERTEQLEKAKEEIWHENLDSYSCRKTRKTTLGEWTDAEEKEYLAQIEKCKKLIAELPPIIPDDVKIISDIEYDKIVREREELRIAEENARIEAMEKEMLEGEEEYVRNEQESE